MELIAIHQYQYIDEVFAHSDRLNLLRYSEVLANSHAQAIF